MSTLSAEERLTALEAVFSALAHPARRQILLTVHFRGGSMPAGEIAGRFAHAWPTTTRHLKVLESAGLLAHEKVGRAVIYRIDRERLAVLQDWLAWFTKTEDEPERSTAMIRGIHGLFYSSKADELRSFLRDKVKLPASDIGGGWLIYDFQEGDLGVHPIDHGGTSGQHDISFFTDDLARTVAEMKGRGVKFDDEIEDHGYGLVTHLTMPGGVRVQVYQPKYVKKSGAKAAAKAKAKPAKAKAKAKPAKAKTKAKARKR